jgi:hypothetical protein
MSSSSPSPSSKVVFGSDDQLFGSIEKTQLNEGKPFGTFLDAGTGAHSLKWMASLIIDNIDADANADTNADANTVLKIEQYTAITADAKMKAVVVKEAKALGIEDKGDIVIGNWQSKRDDGEDELCHGEKFDTILADYLVGAMDGFSPYYQDQIFPRLVQHLKPGGLMHVVGLNPIPDKAPGDANIFCRVTRVRDACILLADHRCYREYPVDWIERHLEKAGLKVIKSTKFPIMYSHEAIVRQLNVARSKLPFFPSKALAKEMRETLDKLENESKIATDKSPNRRLKLGFDYVVTAQMPSHDDS